MWPGCSGSKPPLTIVTRPASAGSPEVGDDHRARPGEPARRSGPRPQGSPGPRPRTRPRDTPPAAPSDGRGCTVRLPGLQGERRHAEHRAEIGEAAVRADEGARARRRPPSARPGCPAASPRPTSRGSWRPPEPTPGARRAARRSSARPARSPRPAARARPRRAACSTLVVGERVAEVELDGDVVARAARRQSAAPPRSSGR